MDTPSPESMSSGVQPPKATELSPLIYKTLERFDQKWTFKRLPARLEFPTELEQAFEQQTRGARIRELRFTVSAAIGFMCATTATDGVLIPDIRWAGLKLRLLSSAVFAAVIFLFNRVSGPVRERLLFWSSYLAVQVIMGAPCLSRSATAPYGMFISFLAVIYCNTTFPLRFRDAWRINLLSLGTIAAYMHFDPVASRGLAGALMFMGVIGASYTLIANYRMERSVRVGYLLASKEALRLEEMHRDRDELAAISTTDGLTGVANRRAFDERLDRLFADRSLHGREVHLILMDVDFFKRYNDRYGHLAGDGCLRAIAQLVARGTRGETDLVFRYGGEEFGALLVSLPGSLVAETAERIRLSIEHAAIEHQNRSDELRVATVSAGVATVVMGSGVNAKSLIEMADKELYRAKATGRNRVCVRGR